MKIKNIVIGAASISLVGALSLSSVMAADTRRYNKQNSYNKNSAETVTKTAAEDDLDDSTNMYKNSDFIEKEQPELNVETKQLISAYQKDPTLENYEALREMVIVNYNAVLDKKEAKLAELKLETEGKPGGEDKVDEMNEIVQEMYANYWSCIDSSMLRFTDTRLLKWNIEDASEYDYIPVMGAGETIYIKRTQVTNAEYAEYIDATGAQVPVNWLTQKDESNTYRLPTESEWELVAGHMPKDAD